MEDDDDDDAEDEVDSDSVVPVMDKWFRIKPISLEGGNCTTNGDAFVLLLATTGVASLSMDD